MSTEQTNPIPQPEPIFPDTSVETRPAFPAWRFWVPLLLQIGLIVAVPSQDAYTYFTGRDVTLQTMPVDPYDFLRGYSQTLSYEISRKDALSKLPGGEIVSSQHNDRRQSFYVILQAPTATNTKPPSPWQPVRISVERPTNLPSNQVALQGQYQNWQVEYGLETYYMPADQRDDINDDIQRTQVRDQQAFVVDVKVDAQGNAVPVSLWVRDRNYRF
jgi:uncharacterized membrane-anchored protein